MARIRNADEALEWLRREGVLLESANGPVANLADLVAGEKIHGSWWGHREGQLIFALTRKMRSSPEVLVCRLLGSKITYLHRDLWPAIVRVSELLEPRSLAAVCEVHTSSGKHVVEKIPFPDWVPKDVVEKARELSLQEAWENLPICLRPRSPDNSAGGVISTSNSTSAIGSDLD